MSDDLGNLATFASPRALIDATGLHPMAENLSQATRRHAKPWTAATVLADADQGRRYALAGGSGARATGNALRLTLDQHDQARRLAALLEGSPR